MLELVGVLVSTVTEYCPRHEEKSEVQQSDVRMVQQSMNDSVL